MVEGVATTEDLATVPVLDTATQEVALEDRTDPLMIQDVEKVNPSSIDVMAKDADTPVVESPAADNLRPPIPHAEVASSSSTSRAERLSEAIIASNDKQAMELRKALSDLSAAYKVNFYLQLSVSSPQGSSFFFDCKGRLDASLLAVDIYLLTDVPFIGGTKLFNSCQNCFGKAAGGYSL